MTLTITKRRFRIANLGHNNPLPMLGAPLENPLQLQSDLPNEILLGSRFGHPENLYPYQEQDSFDRHLSERELTTIILRNDKLTAVFLPELGGRLWELTVNSTRKQLLYSPPTIQFANLALRNAWFAGGVEWNIGTRGHSAQTCEPIHAALVTNQNGDDVLRMWEFDRLRETVFQIDTWLPTGSDWLHVAIRIRNPNTHSVPMYWWSNAAIPEAPGLRIISPAKHSFRTDYGTGLVRVQPDHSEGRDRTHPSANQRAVDFFFDIPAEQRPWITGCEPNGNNLTILSSNRLRGRKMFVWGTGQGGATWQKWLSPDGGTYVEIQAGLAKTQYEHLNMPAGAEWNWVELYGTTPTVSEVCHTSWAVAIDTINRALNTKLPTLTVESVATAARENANQAPKRILYAGSGWGALESLRRQNNPNLGWIDETGTPFRQLDLGPEQLPWAGLLNGDPLEKPTSTELGFIPELGFVRGADWESLLAKYPKSSVALLHRAVMAHARGDSVTASNYYHGVIQLAEKPKQTTLVSVHPRILATARRGLALLVLNSTQNQVNVADDSEIDRARNGIQEYCLACGADPSNSAILVEAMRAAIRYGLPGTAIELFNTAQAHLPSNDPRQARMRLLAAEAKSQSGFKAIAEALSYLNGNLIVPDIREGRNDLADLWRTLKPDTPLPVAINFDMT